MRKSVITLLKANFSAIVSVSILLLCGSIQTLQGQSLELETLGPKVKWRKIKTEHFNVIFPTEFGDEANRTANILEAIHEPGSRSIGKRPRKFSVILQNKNAIANGFVTVLPRRSEFFTTSAQDYKFIGNSDWIEFLATHEYRHMVQFDKAYTGVGKLMYWFFGNYGLGLSAVLGTPNWYWEGDAVGLETSMNATGRGRIPNFYRLFKTNILERGGFSYYKQHHQSFKHSVPNHYRTGYFMTTHLKRKHGVDVWGKITQRSLSFPFVPFSFSNAIKAETGRNLLQTYDDMMADVGQTYKQQLEEVNAETKFELVNQRKTTTFTDYEYPTMLPDGSILALKAGLSDISQFVAIDASGQETDVFTTGIINDPGQLSVQNNKVVWTEYGFDPRWLKQTYSVIKLYDLKIKELKILTKKSKYTVASLSPSGKEIIAIENSTTNQYALHLIDPNGGEIIKVYDNPGNQFYSMPSFSSDGKHIIALKHRRNGKTIVKIDKTSGVETELLSSGEENLGHPRLYNEYLFYNSDFNGLDNIFAYNVVSGAKFMVTSSKYGAYNPSPSKDGKHLVYNDFGKDGMNVAKAPLDQSLWIPIDNVKRSTFDYHEPMVEGEGHQDLLPNIEYKKFQSSRYSKLKNIINPFSWGVSVLALSNSVILGVNSQDILSTTSLSGGLLYNGNERNWLKFGSVSYQGWYPIIDLSISSGTRSTDELIEGQVQQFDWQETSFTAGLRVPLLLTNSKYLRKLTFESKLRRTQVSGYDNPVLNLRQIGNGNLNGLEHSIEFVRQLKRSKRDIDPRFGQTVKLDYRHTPIGGDYFTTLVALESNLFFPGLAKHHSFRVRGSYQYEDKVNYRFRSPVTYTRGFGYIAFDRYINWSVNYKAPIWYPDVHLGPVLNVQRIYANVFYDRGTGTRGSQNSITLQSYGTELSANFNLMRFAVLFDMGLRYSYLPDFNDSVVELIVGRFTF